MKYRYITDIVCIYNTTGTHNILSIFNSVKPNFDDRGRSDKIATIHFPSHLLFCASKIEFAGIETNISECVDHSLSLEGKTPSELSLPVLNSNPFLTRKPSLNNGILCYIRVFLDPLRTQRHFDKYLPTSHSGFPLS